MHNLRLKWPLNTLVWFRFYPNLVKPINSGSLYYWTKNWQNRISLSLSYQNSIKYWNKSYFSILREKHATKTFNSGERNTLTSDFLKWSSQRSPFKPLDSTTVTWWNLKLIEGSTHHSEKRLVCPDLLSWHVEYPISIQVQLVELSWFITRYEKNISYFRSSEIEIFPNNYLNFNK